MTFADLKRRPENQKVSATSKTHVHLLFLLPESWHFPVANQTKGTSKALICLFHAGPTIWPQGRSTLFGVRSQHLVRCLHESTSTNSRRLCQAITLRHRVSYGFFTEKSFGSKGFQGWALIEQEVLLKMLFLHLGVQIHARSMSIRRSLEDVDEPLRQLVRDLQDVQLTLRQFDDFSCYC